MMLITWSSHDHHMIVTWSSHDLHIIFTWSSHDLAWSSHDHHMISHDPYTILTRSSHNPHTILTCSLHKWLMAHCWCVDMHPVGSCACTWRYCNIGYQPPQFWILALFPGVVTAGGATTPPAARQSPCSQLHMDQAPSKEEEEGRKGGWEGYVCLCLTWISMQWKWLWGTEIWFKVYLQHTLGHSHTLYWLWVLE